MRRLAAYLLLAAAFGSVACRRSGGHGALPGTGGSAGTGGTGGTAGNGGGAAGQGWLQNAVVWSEVSGAGGCGLWVADIAKAGGPTPRIWTPCAVGCQEAPAKILETDVGVYRGAGAAIIEGELYLRLTSGNPNYRLTVVSRLSDGAMVAAVQQRNLDVCVPLGGASAPLLIAFSAGDNGATLAGLVKVADGSIAWSPIISNIPPTGELFANETGWGSQFQDGSVRLLSPPNATTMETIDQGTAPTFQIAGLLDRVVWSSAEAGRDAEVIKSYTQTEGLRVLAAQDTNDHAVAMSDSNVVWIGTTGPQRHDGLYDGAQLFWTKWPTSPGSTSITTGPMLPATTALLSLSTGGDFAATIGCTATVDSCQLFVVQLSSGRLWAIHSRPGSVFLDVISVSGEAILLNEIDNPGAPELRQQTQRLVRLDPSHLAELQQAW